jgi:hypothetical protein
MTGKVIPLPSDAPRLRAELDRLRKQFATFALEVSKLAIRAGFEAPGVLDDGVGALMKFWRHPIGECSPCHCRAPLADGVRLGLHAVISSRRDRLPRGIVRDLLAIARVLYRAELARKPDAMQPARLAQLQAIGTMLRRALDLSRGEPDTMGHRAAWGWAEKATAALGQMVGEHLPLAAVLRASTEKLRTGS